MTVPFAEPNEATKTKREYKSRISDWAKSKIDLTTLHHQGVEENIFKRKVRDEEEYVSKTCKADELHEV